MHKPPIAGASIRTTPPRMDDPHSGDDFARVYEMTANRITGPVAVQALRQAGPVVPGTRVLDIAAGAGALSIPAAFSGASLLAVDNAPGMVRLLNKRLEAFPDANATLMDGQALAIDSESFDIAFSIFGVILFDQWRRGLEEQFRILRAGGKGCVGSWKTLPGGGPFIVMGKAMRAIFPDRMPPLPPEGFIALSDSERLASEMQAAGFADVQVNEVDTIWRGESGPAYLDELHDLHRFMPFYAGLDDGERRRVDEAILGIIKQYICNGGTEITSTALLATGTKK